MVFFPAKILLFGEYNLLKNGEAIVMPYFKYKGFFNALTNHNKTPNNIQLHQALAHLLIFFKNQNLDFFNIQAFENDILTQKIFFDSDIPQGYGVGSSGALTAALYHHYTTPASELHVLKTQLACLESCFHGSSSGIDPLISYIQKQLHICSNNNIQIIEKPFFEPTLNKAPLHVFLINTGIARQTAPLVQIFKQKCTNPNFEKQFNTELIEPTNNAIYNLLNIENELFIENLQQISLAQKKLLVEMIPASFMPLWEKGLATKTYFLKLCGAGGGGFLLGFTQKKETTQKIFKSLNINFLDWLFCIIVMFCIGTKQSFGQNNSTAQSNGLQILVNELVQTHTKKDTTYSIAVGIIDSQNIYRFFYGNNCTTTAQQPPNANTLFHIGAITKVFTALLTLSLNNQNIINIYNPITDYLPDSISRQNSGLKNITIYQLLTHTSGFPREPYNKAFTIISPDNPYSNYTIQDLYNFLINYKVSIKQQKKPTFRYSHVGMGILTHLIENATNKSYDNLLNEQILTPLKLYNTTLQPTQNQLKRLCSGRNFNGNVLPTLKYASMQGSEALFSTLNDLVQVAFCSIDTLNCPNLPTYIKKSIIQSQQIQYKTTVEYAKVGLGWYIVQRNKKSPQIITHSGRTGGYSNFIALIPNTKTAVVLLSNSNNIIDQLGLDILELINR